MASIVMLNLSLGIGIIGTAIKKHGDIFRFPHLQIVVRYWNWKIYIYIYSLYLYIVSMYKFPDWSWLVCCRDFFRALVFSTHCVNAGAEVTPALGILDLVQMIIALGFIIWSRPQWMLGPSKMIQNGNTGHRERRLNRKKWSNTGFKHKHWRFCRPRCCRFQL